MRKIKSTSFNVNDEFEKELLLYVEQKENGNFSRYIKRLIVKDRDSENIVYMPVNNGTIPFSPVENREQDEDIEAMEGFL